MTAGLLGGVLVLGGCTGWKAARLYSAGSDALLQGDIDASIADLEEAARLLPERSEIQNHLGIAYASVGRDEDALAAFERSVALDCQNDPAHENLVVTRQRIAFRRAAEAAAKGGTSAGEAVPPKGSTLTTSGQGASSTPTGTSTPPGGSTPAPDAASAP